MSLMKSREESTIFHIITHDGAPEVVYVSYRGVHGPKKFGPARKFQSFLRPGPALTKNRGTQFLVLHTHDATPFPAHT